jgi:predicted nucleic acid-binding protein
VSESDLLFDTWAWWEYLHATAVGTSLRRRFLEGARFRVHTSTITLAELSAKLEADGTGDRISSACGAIRRMSHLWDVTADIAQEAGPARTQLRESSTDASLADAIIYVTARRAGARIVSADPAFRRVPGVVTG